MLLVETPSRVGTGHRLRSESGANAGETKMTNMSMGRATAKDGNRDRIRCILSEADERPRNGIPEKSITPPSRWFVRVL